MWKLLIGPRLRANSGRNLMIGEAEIARAASVLFVVFTRYGDSVISFKLIGEFISRRPGKRYMVVTTNQALPYAERLIGGKAELVALNKRKDPVKVIRLISALKASPPELAFNPWSQGIDSEYLLTFAKAFSVFNRFPSEPMGNIYERVRRYFALGRPGGPAQARKTDLGGARRVVISPFSTAPAKNIDARNLGLLVATLKERLPGARITVAAMKEELKSIGPGVERFMYRKDRKGSEGFLALLDSSDLVISVDSGPLHLADALGKATIGVFGPTPPEGVLDLDTGVVPVRVPELSGSYCHIFKGCGRPVCMDRLFEGGFLSHTARIDFDAATTGLDNCPFEAGKMRKGAVTGR